MSDLNYPLTNVQIELMKLFATNLSDSDLDELKDLIARFFAHKAVQQANEIWDKNGLTNYDMDRLLNSQS